MSDFSFPYPTCNGPVRPAGQGCKSCVHMTYCPAVYWFARYGVEKRTIDDHMGKKCDSWSNVMSAQVKIPTEGDLDEQDYIFIQGIGSEADRCGISDAVTASNRK